MNETNTSAEAIHTRCGSPVTLDRERISEGDTETFPTEQHGPYYVAVCLTCDEDLFEHEVAHTK